MDAWPRALCIHWGTRWGGALDGQSQPWDRHHVLCQLSSGPLHPFDCPQSKSWVGWAAMMEMPKELCFWPKGAVGT